MRDVRPRSRVGLLPALAPLCVPLVVLLVLLVPGLLVLSLLRGLGVRRVLGPCGLLMLLWGRLVLGLGWRVDWCGLLDDLLLGLGWIVPLLLLLGPLLLCAATA